MTSFLDTQDVLEIAEVIVGHRPGVRDIGLLDSAAHRPQVSMFDQEAYPDLATKAAALLESLVRNHPFVDGNRVAWSATATFLLDNGWSLLDSNQDDAYDFVIAVAEGRLELKEIAAWLADNVKPFG